MRELTILHTSDLCISPSTDSKSIFYRLADELAERDLKGRGDYLIVSGNVTNDGTIDSFREAQTTIRILADELLRPDKSSSQLNRILIVPGWRDVLATGDLANFAAFHNEFFADELGRSVEHFDPEGAIVRELKDLTLVGIAYWRRPDATPQSLDDVRRTIAAARQKLVKLDYTNATPTILVSASGIAFDGRAESLQSYEALQDDLKIHLKTTLHLFGGGDVPAVLPSPLTFHHVAIGTGARANEFWPFTMNILELRRHAFDASVSSHGTHFITSRVFQMLSPDTKPRELPWLAGQLDAFYKHVPNKADRDVLYSPLLQQLENHLRPGAAIAIMGFPGAGKSILFDHLAHRTKLVDRNISVIPMTVYGYDDFSQRLQAALNTFRSLRTDPDAMPVLLIHDLCFGRLPNSEKSELTNALFGVDGRDDPRKLEAGLSVVILLTTSDVQPELFEILSLPPMKPHGIATLAREYATRTPVDASQLQALAGGYVGFSELLLKAASDWFDNLSGAQSIDRDMPSVVMQRALFASTVAMKSRLHRANLQLVTAGEDVCRYIEAQIGHARNGTDERDVVSLRPIRIDVGKLEEQYRTDPPRAISMRKAVRHLQWAGILTNDETTNSSLYTVRVLAPFLSISTASPDEWPSISRQDMTSPVDVLIVTPLPKERDAMLAKLPNHERVDSDGLVYYFSNVPITFPGGRKGVYRVVVMNLDQAGQVEAAVGVMKAAPRWNPAVVLLVGIAGGVKAAQVSPGDVLVADRVAYSGLQKVKPAFREIRWDMGHVDRELQRAIQNFPIGRCRSITADRPDDGIPQLHIGPMVTGDDVVASEEELKKYMATVPKLIGIEMEAWGIMRAIAETGRSFLMIRGVSDLADAAKDDRWHEYACDVAASYAIDFLRSGPFRPMPKQGRERS